MKKIWAILSVLLISQVAISMYAQNKPKVGDVISGIVTDSVRPLKGANVTERDSSDHILAHCITDENGYFSFRLVNPNDIIQISYVGYKIYNIPITDIYHEVKLDLWKYQAVEELKTDFNEFSSPHTVPNRIDSVRFIIGHRIEEDYTIPLPPREEINTSDPTVSFEGIVYSRNNWSVLSVDDNYEMKSHITIPDSITVDGKKYKVWGISGSAFEGNTDIVTVTLPDSLRVINSRAFKNCSNLRQINIPRNCFLTYNVFENCTSLEEIVIHSGFNLENGTRLFTGCTSLKRVVIEKGEHIGAHFFDGCTSLEELVLPSSMDDIGYEAFAGCYNLKKIIINHTGVSNYLHMSVVDGAFPDMSLLEKAVADAAAHEILKAGDIIHGVVRDADGNPLNMVYVKELDTEGHIFNHDLTASNGKFSFWLSNPDNRIEFYTMGYETVNLPLNTAYYLINLIEKPDTTVVIPSRKKDLSGSHRRHEYVDLGLSVKWATCNIGAETPDDPGDLYAWGETEQKYVYSWSNYKWCKGDECELTKYCTVSSYGYNGFTDNKTVLDPEDDVAHAKWGGRWRMPTVDEFMELCLNCTWTWTTCNNVQGYRITSRIPGYEDSSIFLPTCDGYSGLLPFYQGFHGEYMSSSLSPDYPSSCFILRFTSEQVDWYGYRRQFSRSVRAVCP